MATRNTRLSVDITADDNASRVIRDVQGEARQLDQIDPEIDVTVDDNATSKLDALKGSVGGLAGLAGGAAVTGLFALADAAANAAIEAQTLADLTGTTVENASRLQTVFENTSQGGEANDLLDIILQMNQTLAENPELVDELGIAFDASKPSAETFIDVVDALNASQLSQNDKVVLMGQLFGEEGVRQVGAMITAVGDLSDAVDDVPGAAVISDADVQRALEYKENWAEFKTTMNELGLVVLPVVDAAMSTITGLLNSRPGTGQSPGAAGLLARGFQPAGPDLSQDQMMGMDLTGARPSNVTIINPPGTPATTVGAQRVYGGRNGDR